MCRFCSMYQLSYILSTGNLSKPQTVRNKRLLWLTVRNKRLLWLVIYAYRERSPSTVLTKRTSNNFPFLKCTFGIAQLFTKCTCLLLFNIFISSSNWCVVNLLNNVIKYLVAKKNFQCISIKITFALLMLAIIFGSVYINLRLGTNVPWSVSDVNLISGTQSTNSITAPVTNRLLNPLILRTNKI